MTRYLIEREFPDTLVIPLDDAGAGLCRSVVDNNAEEGVTWVHSYVTPDGKHTFCIYDGPPLRPSAARRPVTNCPFRGSPRFASSIHASKVSEEKSMNASKRSSRALGAPSQGARTVNIRSSLSGCINVARSLIRPLPLFALFAVAPATVIAAPHHARAAATVSAKVSLGDLDLNTQAGINAAHERLAATAKRLCRTFSDTTQISDQITAADCYEETLADAIRHFDLQWAAIQAAISVVARNATNP